MEIASSAGARPILSVLASRTVKASVSPAARRLIASARWCSESFRLRPLDAVGHSTLTALAGALSNEIALEVGNGRRVHRFRSPN
jgi:hypothetical protein